MKKYDFENWMKNPLKPLIMGIVNTTPDSFSDGGIHSSAGELIDFAYELIDQGADIIDIGGESTRPGSEKVSSKEEIRRISPVVKELSKNCDCAISVDTYKSSTAKFALENGVSIINDISGLTFDPSVANTVSDHNAALVLMHIKGDPKTMQDNTEYSNLIDEISSFLNSQIEFAIQKGVKREKIIVDPGIGFGKALDDNFEIIGKLSKICKLGYPVLVGPSRKSFIGSVLNADVSDRIEGSLAAACASYMNGAKIVRVHDVFQTKKCLQIIEKIIERS